MKKEDKPKRGGARKGAGRPKHLPENKRVRVELFVQVRLKEDFILAATQLRDEMEKWKPVCDK